MIGLCLTEVSQKSVRAKMKEGRRIVRPSCRCEAIFFEALELTNLQLIQRFYLQVAIVDNAVGIVGLEGYGA